MGREERGTCTLYSMELIVRGTSLELNAERVQRVL